MNQYGIIPPCSFYIFSLVDNNRRNTNNSPFPHVL
ncbi:hypothetical protein CASFOL_007876 [Castilleja foliolosa]|uniref:Uncharacterized protein n=1 Tax=Castilleja foliolosa TaxID=1961234 RepID=A0ABD3E356_9LAMI